MRIGHGFDVHKLVEGRKLILGGVEFDFPLGLEGHSDADVLAHAVTDALFGAAGLGDIGMHFPDSDPTYKDASSIGLLEIATKAVGSLGYTITNIDATIVAQAPRIAPLRADIVWNLAKATGVDPARVNVKATTTEHLGFTGTGEGIAASAVVLLTEKDTSQD